MTQLRLHHVAVLVRSLSSVERSLPQDLERLDVATFPDEGTTEQYIDLDPTGRPSLLLVEATGDGPYRRALAKRGPGLHHLGYVTDRLEDAVEHFAEERLLLHPYSLKSLPNRVVWMCRPGVPFLIEIQEDSEPAEDTSPPIHLGLPIGADGILPETPGVTIGLPGGPLIELSSPDISFTINP